MRYLLDTNIISEALKKPNGKIARKFSRLKAGSFGLSTIVSCEILYRLEKHPSDKIANKIRRGLQTIPVLDIPAAAAKTYGTIRANLERRGLTIGANDMLIAAHAIHANLTLVSDNVKEFDRVPGLKVENWLRE